ncbi:hypothetical protein [Micromonospora sp. KC606]|uniref:hypothetical protein n=1 Tax=Micromonospora sp. KC606 TaxID=2530379 RepID=UPI001A9DC9F2|nr:hypothetical protein [Micromonospora sp. KC606]
MELVLTIALALLSIGLITQVAAASSRRGDNLRLAEIERKLQLVMDRLGVVDDRPAPPGVREHLTRGEKIKAIKAYREATGADLRTAKEAVEALMERR